MRLKRSLSIYAAALTAFFAFAGGEGANAQDPVTITFWNGFTSSDRPVVEALVERFNTSQQKAKVEMTIMPWDVFFQKLLPAYAAGQGPTIAAMDNSQVPGYASKGVIAPLDDIYTSGAVPADKVAKASVDSGVWNGQRFSVPMAFTPTMLYWNKTLFKNAGIENPPKNWDEWGAAAEKLTDVSGDEGVRKYGFAVPDHAAIPQWAIFLWGNGGGVDSADHKTSTLGSPESIEAVEYWSKLIIDKHISPVGLSGVDADNLFGSQRAAMLVNGPWASAGFDKAGVDYGIAPVPAGPKGEATIAIAVGLTVDAAASPEEKAAAYEFMAFWNSTESQKYWSDKTGFPPTRTDIPASELASKTAAAFSAGAGAARFYLAGILQFAAINDTVVVPTIQRILNNRGTPAELLPEAAKQIDTLLQQQ